MVAYEFGVLLLIKSLKLAYTDVTQPWYADNSSALGTFDNLELHFNSLKINDRVQGYYPNSIKIIIIVHNDNLESGKLFGAHHVFRVFTVTRYLGSYIRDEKYK